MQKYMFETQFIFYWRQEGQGGHGKPIKRDLLFFPYFLLILVCFSLVSAYLTVFRAFSLVSE